MYENKSDNKENNSLLKEYTTHIETLFLFNSTKYLLPVQHFCWTNKTFTTYKL